MRGWIRTAVCVPPLHLGNPHENAQEIIQKMDALDRRGVHIAVFPELSLTGATLGDLYRQSALTEAVSFEMERICRATENYETLYLIGAPAATNHGVVSQFLLLHQGEVVGRSARRRLTMEEETGRLRGIDPFPEATLFFTLPTEQGEVKLAVLGITDLKDGATLREAQELGVDLILSPVALPATVGEAGREIRLAEQLSGLGFGLAMASAGEGESGTDALFAGMSWMAQGGHLLAYGETLTEPAWIPGASEAHLSGDMVIADIDLDQVRADRERSLRACGRVVTAQGSEIKPLSLKKAFRLIANPQFVSVDPAPLAPENPEQLEEILQLQTRGLIRRMRQIRADQVWIGLSGGLDSTLSMLVSLRAFEKMNLPRHQLHLVSMPAFGTGTRTRNNARDLGEASGCDFREISLTSVLTQHFVDIGLPEGDHSVAFENAQARERTQILMDLANLHGGLHVGTGDLSESVLGWSTYNGDHMSMYNPNGSITKTLARRLVAYEAGHRPELEETLKDILDTPISPELLPGEQGAIAQKTEEIVGPYELHDFFIYHFLHEGSSPEKVYVLARRAFEGAYSGDEILKTMRIFLKRFFASQFKRSASADGVGTMPVSISPRGGWMMPSDATGQIWLDAVEALELREKVGAAGTGEVAP